MSWLTLLLALIAVFCVAAYFRVRLWQWSLVWLAVLALSALLASSLAATITFAVLTLPPLLIFNVPPLRRALVMNRLFQWFRRQLPRMSDTEREALEAGTVWWDAELFSGKPRWEKLLATPAPQLTEEERAFMDGPVNQLCAMVEDWDVTQRMDLSPEAWAYIKSEGFLGLIIPKGFGGKGFSALAHAEIVTRIATRSGTAAVCVMVPNSLGPAELLLHYGTEAQQQYYLPRLASGDEIPCFALTGPYAGSDAGSMRDRGVVCRGMYEGKEVLGFRVTWEKRYITLAPIATVLGLAFKAYDPDHLLGDEEELGITLALIPTGTEGVEIGRRHLPLNSAFMNGPTWGKDVFIPLDQVIGGQKMIGKGWMMLMNALSAGRAISLPSSGAATGLMGSMVCGGYARVREQFNVPIGEFEGIQEVLARIGGNTYLMDAARRITAQAIDQGEKPSVLGAILKYHLTERGRQCVNDAMDIHGGKGICMGPNNYLGLHYQNYPIGITVEGANILTRNMIIFGQGAIRCHPYLLKEMEAANLPDRKAGLAQFDRALTSHLGFVYSNGVRALWLGLTDGRLRRVPGSPAIKRYLQRLDRMSAAFALVADLTLMLLGGELKRKENLSARLGDQLSLLYLGSATLKRFEDEGRLDAHLPLLQWAMDDLLYQSQETLRDVLNNFPNRVLAWKLRLLTMPLGRRYRRPGDRLNRPISELLMTDSEARDLLLKTAYRSSDSKDAVGRVEYALHCVLAAAPVERKLRKAVKTEQVAAPPQQGSLTDAALAAGIIDASEADLLRMAEEARRAVIMVDDFARSDIEPGFQKAKE